MLSVCNDISLRPPSLLTGSLHDELSAGLSWSAEESGL